MFCVGHTSDDVGYNDGTNVGEPSAARAVEAAREDKRNKTNIFDQPTKNFEETYTTTPTDFKFWRATAVDVCRIFILWCKWQLSRRAERENRTHQSRIMNESIEEWLAQVTTADYKVWVENPETQKESGFMGKSFITFRVLLKSSDTELIAIRHRFSEFCQLRDILRVRPISFPGPRNQR
jgi:hypothetical protein